MPLQRTLHLQRKVLNSRNAKFLGINNLKSQNSFIYLIILCIDYYYYHHHHNYYYHYCYYFYCIEWQNNLGWNGPLEIVGSPPPPPKNSPHLLPPPKQTKTKQTWD